MERPNEDLGGSAMPQTMGGDEARICFPPWDAFFASHRLRYATNFEIATCVGCLVHFAPDDPWAACWASLLTGTLGVSPLRFIKTCKSCYRRGVMRV